ncbi:MAG: dTMP kinase [Planctomycetota bacterium]|nr:dTMP kinase [Planctomycetota bacterium]
MPKWIQGFQGRFLVFDGPDGSGKSTQFRRFSSWLKSHHIPVTELREPGGTPIGERIRDVLLDVAHEEMTITCEMLLYMASRAQIVEEVVKPALERRDLVLADRFISSTHAYQGAGGGFSREAIDRVGEVAVGTLMPDLTIVFDVDQETAAHRLNPLLDRMEQKGELFHARVREGYLDLARRNPEKVLVIDARPDEDTVFTALLEGLQSRLDAMSTTSREPDSSSPKAARSSQASS